MQSIHDMPVPVARGLAGVLTDIDGTITADGKLTAAAYQALWRLKAAGLRVVRIVSISEGGGYNPPMPVMYAKADMAEAAMPTPIAAGQVEATVNVSVQFELAP